MKIAETINPGSDDILVEIGPGTGALTEVLRGLPAKYYAVEIDRRVILDLEISFPEVKIIEADFMKFDLINLFQSENEKKLIIAGNIPYNLTSPILFKLLENRDIIKTATMMIQLEVAERIAAKPGTRNSGILSTLAQTFCGAELCFKVSRDVFFPKPDVTSAVIRLTFDGRNPDINFDFFRRMVKAAFSKRRKQLKNSFKGTEFEQYLSDTEMPVDMMMRPEQLILPDFYKLYNYFFSRANIDSIK